MANPLVLTKAVEALSDALNLESITRIIADSARQIAGADGATFVLRDEDQCFYFDENAISPLWKGKKFPLEMCISGWSMLNKQVVLIPDIYSDSRVPQDAYRPTFVKSLCMVPIRAHDPIGAIGCYWSNGYQPNQEQIKMLQILANTTATTLENFELKQKLSRRNLEKEVLTKRQEDLELQLHSLVHDLKSPLTTMMGFTEMLQMRLQKVDDKKSKEYAESILSVGDSLHRQIDKMLNVYRLSQSSIEKQFVDLTPLAHQIVEGLIAQNPTRDYQISIDSNMKVMADLDLIRMALENLIANAFKYSARKDQVWVRIGKVEQDATAESQQFFIEDRGAGFSPKDVDKLFKPLSRLHKDTEFEGTGLGLASVARIIELHGGQVSAEGRPAEGAKFYFTLPRQ